jgi:hypothetical protein
VSLLAGAHTGRFSLGALVACVLLPAALARLLQGLRPRRGSGAPWAIGRAELALLALAALWWSRPAQLIVVEGMDAAHYLWTAGRLAGQGALLDEEGPEVRRALAGRLIAPSGMFELPGGVWQPAYFHLFSVWLGLFYRLGGLGLVRHAPPLCGWLTLLLWLLYWRRAWDQGTALCAAVVLLANPAQSRFSHLSMSEIPTQLVLAGLLLTLLPSRGAPRPRRDDLTGAALLTLLLAMRIDAVLAGIPLLLCVLTDRVTRTAEGDSLSAAGEHGSLRRRLATLLPWLLAAPLAAVYVGWSSRSYATSILAYVQTKTPACALPAVLLGLIPAVLVLARLLRSARRARPDALRTALALLFLGVFAALTIRSLLAARSPAIVEARTVVRLAKYLNWPFLVLGAVGAAALILRADRVTLPFLAATAPATLLLLWRPFHSTMTEWWVRRYLLEAVPLLATGVGWLAAMLLRRRRAWAVLLALGILLAAVDPPRLVRMATTPRGPDIVPQLRGLGSRLPPGTISLCPDTRLGRTLGPSMRYLFGRDAWIVAAGDHAALAAVGRELRSRLDRPVRLVLDRELAPAACRDGEDLGLAVICSP